MKLGASTAAAVAALTLTASAGAHLIRPGCNSHLRPRAELACAIANRDHAQATLEWARKFQRSGQLASFEAAASLKLGQVVRSHRWLYRTMTARIAEARGRLARVLPAVNDWLTAVRVVQRVYPGSQAWLESCSGGEGGHGLWVWNGGAPIGSASHGSGAGGWLQYMVGTFWHDFGRALADARARGFVVPASAASWSSPLGQALAGGWAYGNDRPSGKWTGGGC